MQMFIMPCQGVCGGGDLFLFIYLFMFPQVLRITFQGKSRSDQFKPNRFLGVQTSAHQHLSGCLWMFF